MISNYIDRLKLNSSTTNNYNVILLLILKYIVEKVAFVSTLRIKKCYFILQKVISI